jgi:hypothetical protein
MVGEIPCEVPYDRTYKIVVKVFGLLVGANYVINARRELILIEMSCHKIGRQLHGEQKRRIKASRKQAHIPRRNRVVDSLYSAQFSPIAAFSSV